MKIAGCVKIEQRETLERSCKLDWNWNKKEIHLAIEEEEGLRRSKGRLHYMETLSLMPLLHIMNRASHVFAERTLYRDISVCYTIKSAIDMKLFRHSMAKYMAIVFVASNIFSWRVFHKIQTSPKDSVLGKQKISYLQAVLYKYVKILYKYYKRFSSDI